jgi:hypothetical protein
MKSKIQNSYEKEVQKGTSWIPIEGSGLWQFLLHSSSCRFGKGFGQEAAPIPD